MAKRKVKRKALKSNISSKGKNRSGFHLAYRITRLAILIAGLLLLLSLYLPKLYATFAPETKIDPIVLERKYFWIVIPKIKVDSPVLPAVTKELLRSGVAHVPESGYPGEGKNIIIAGHNYDPTKWNPQTTFGLLYELEKGDEVLVAYQGRVFRYLVDRKISLTADDPALYAKTDREQLTLLTCMPYQNKTKRLKVVALPK